MVSFYVEQNKVLLISINLIIVYIISIYNIYRMGFTLVEKYFTPEDIKGADSAFFTGTAAEVAGIGSIDRVPFKLKWEDSLGSILQAKYTRRVAFNEYGNFSLV